MIYGKHFIVDNKLINSEEYEIQIPVVKMSHGDWQKKYKIQINDASNKVLVVQHVQT